MKNKIIITLVLLPLLLSCKKDKEDGYNDVAQAPIWTIDANNFENSMQLVCTATYGYFTLGENSTDMLGAFINDELRGVASDAEYIESLNTYVFYLSVLGNTDDQSKTISFKLFDASEMHLNTATIKIDYYANDLIGSAREPINLN